MSKWTVAESWFGSWDDTKLFYRTWEPQERSSKALIVIHRGHEHSGRVAQQIEDLDLGDFWAFSWDCRGHGRSPGDRGYADSYYDLVKDLDAFVRYVSKKHNIDYENIAVVANSVGAVTASTWVHDFAPRIRAMVLAAPAFRIKLYVPFAMSLLRLLQKIKGRSFISSYVKSKMLTHDTEQSKSYDEDELITRDIAVNVLIGLHDTSTRIIDDAGAIFTPTLVLSAGADWVVKNSAHKKFFDRLSSKKKELEVYPGFFHAILYEKDRMKPLAKAREFIVEAFKEDVDRSFLLKAHESGYTKDEYDRLRGPATFPNGLIYGFQKFMMATVGKQSDGIKLGWETGFDSGKSLDYVYENTPKGTPPFGKMIDKSYLEAVGWKGIRERGANLSACLDFLVKDMLDSGQSVRIMDLATGCGRYVLDVLKKLPEADISALLRDYEPRNLEAGRKLAESMGLKNVKYEQGDAFDTTSILAAEPRPNILIVSGLYELFPDNEMILASLKGVSGVVQDGGYFIYTCQPWHPQVEQIARTCINRDGDPWIMRRRTQAEMDELVLHSGFEKTDMKIDSYGIFTVAVAKKKESK